ncbi:MAG: hypothetical protein KDK39_05840 [Leptospiraceae bacterium]|nr:hypothetical protein [Leptospiraceae bacterium]
MAKKSPGVARLLSIMRKLSEEVNDIEICRRLEILMNSEKEDLPANIIRTLVHEPEKFDPQLVQDPYSQYIRHYLYMVKRSNSRPVDLIAERPRKKKKVRKGPESAGI